MKRLIALLLIATQAWAGLPPTTTQGLSDTSPKTKFALQAPNFQMTDLGGVKSLIETGNHNLLADPGLESGTTGKWTKSGTGTWSASTSSTYSGKYAGLLALSSQQGEVYQDVTPLNATNAVPMVAACAVKTSLTDVSVCARTNGTDIQCNTVSGTNSWQLMPVNFTGPADGTTVGVSVKNGSSESGNVYVDSCYVGVSSTPQNFGQVSQAVEWGSATWATTASCTWSASSSNSMVSFTANSSCPTPTVTANASAPATKIPAIQINNAPPGHYYITATARVYPGSNGDRFCAQLWDGSTSLGINCGRGTDSTTPAMFPFTVTGEVDYSTAGNHQIEIRGLANTTTLVIDNSLDVSQTQIKVFKYPSTSEIAYRPDVLPASWSGYSAAISGGCAYAASSTYGDPSACTSIAVTPIVSQNLTCVQAASSAPAITCTFAKPGPYKISGSVVVSDSASTARLSARLIDGSGTVIDPGKTIWQSAANVQGTIPFGGQYNVAAAGSVTFKVQLASNGTSISITQGNATGSGAIMWNVEAAGQGTGSPLLMGSVTSTSAGQEHIERAYMGSACTSGTCSGVVSTPGISGVTWSSTGIYNVGFVAGTFSGAPTCTASSLHYASGANNCGPNGAASTSTQAVQCYNSGTGVQNEQFSIICMGPR